jgi:glycosyltransferase involved in cell wall biosynthesis
MQTTKPRIAIDCRSLQDNSRFRGIGTVVRQLVSHLPDKQSFYLLVEAGRGTIDPHGVAVISFKPPTRSSQYGPRLSAFLRAEGVRHCHFMAQYNVPNNFQLSYSVTVHDLFNEHLLRNAKKYKRALSPMLDQLKQAKALIAISNYTKQSILNEWPQAPVRVIYNGVDDTIANAKPASSGLALSQTDTPFILYMGNFEARKNFLGALKAFVELRKQLPKVQLVALTGPWPVPAPWAIVWRLIRYRSTIQCRARVTLPELSDLISQAAAVFIPSHAEGFGLPVLEAMTVGTPVVCANTTALPEVAQNAARLIDPTCVTSMAEGLHQVLTDTAYRQTLFAAMPHVLAKFSVDTMANNYQSALLSMVPSN